MTGTRPRTRAAGLLSAVATAVVALIAVVPQPVAAYNHLGCFAPTTIVLPPAVQQLPPPPQTPLPAGAPLLVQDCSDHCSASAAALALLSLTNTASPCLCMQAQAVLDSQWTMFNLVECSVRCQDGLPCGGPVPAQYRYSVYNVSQLTLPQASQSTSGLQSTPTQPAPSGGGSTTNENLGPGNSINQKQIAIIVGCGAGALVLIAVGIFLIHRHRKLQAVPAIPTLDSDRSSEYLIPKLLPRTPNQLYSVYAPYNARRSDELSLFPNQVVVIRNTYADGWAMGTDLATGVAGVFPLVCLIPDRNRKSAPRRLLEIPERTQASIHINMVLPPLLHSSSNSTVGTPNP